MVGVSDATEMSGRVRVEERQFFFLLLEHNI